jgi:hypothetical protein
MSTAVRPARRRLAWIVATLGLVLLTLVLLRKPLAAAAITSSLRLAGAGDIRLSVAEASPWGVLIENLGFQVRTQRFDARRVKVDRKHWWSASLGAVQVEGARVPVTIDGSDTNPWAWSTYQGAGPASPSAVSAVPVERVSVDGVLVVKAAGQAEREVTVKFAAQLGADDRWAGHVEADGPGLMAKVEAEFAPATARLDFRLTQAQVDLARWQGFIQAVVVLPGGRWDLAGQLSATARGSYAGDQLAAQGTVALRDGRFHWPEREVTAEGVTADFTFTDFARILSEPGRVTMRELRAGQITAREVDLGLAFEGFEKLSITHATLQAFGGRLAAEPFRFFPLNHEVEFTVVADGIIVEQVMALAKDVPAKARGVVDGRLPIRVDAGGLRLGTGWLELKRGTYAEVQLDAAGLLTRGVAPSNPSYPTLKKVESGLLRLQLTELRLDIRPPNQPAGRSATIKIAGEPVDKEVKAPVNLSLNVNGPIEQLLNLGLDRRINFGGKR